MRILYRQSSNEKRNSDMLAQYGISNCYFKSIKLSGKEGSGTKKRHSHAGYEFHIMLERKQIYATDKGEIALESGKILAFSKGASHALVANDHPTSKYAFTFMLDETFFCADEVSDCTFFELSERILSNIRAAESLQKDKTLKAIFIEYIVFETVCLLLEGVGAKRRGLNLPKEETRDESDRDERVELAIQFIKDNIESSIRVSEVASYCYISEKQLGRLFFQGIGQNIASYIRSERLRRIEELLSDTKLSLSEISDRFGFPSEHGFNVFFKKYNGMPPGEYRKMTTNGIK